MAVLIIPVENMRKLYIQTQLFGNGRAEDDASFRQNLRLIAAVLLAHWSDTKPDLSGETGHIFDVLTSEKFYKEGYNSTSDYRLWTCSYIGFEKITSKWAKEKFPNAHGYICMRVVAFDAGATEKASHTIQFYY